MYNTFERLTEILRNGILAAIDDDNRYLYTDVVDYMMAHGVTIATDNKWIPVTERLPKNFISVLGYMTDAGDFPPVRECYTVGNAFFFPALGDKHPVSHWMEMPQPPKEG